MTLKKGVYAICIVMSFGVMGCGNSFANGNETDEIANELDVSHISEEFSSQGGMQESGHRKIGNLITGNLKVGNRATSV